MLNVLTFHGTTRKLRKQKVKGLMFALLTRARTNRMLAFKNKLSYPTNVKALSVVLKQKTFDGEQAEDDFDCQIVC